MCFSFIVKPSDKARDDLQIDEPTYDTFLQTQGLEKEQASRYYARKPCPVVVPGEGGNELQMMHWDLIPSWYMQGKGLSVPEVIKAKNSKADGFSSFNARIEGIEKKASFRKAWTDKRRCLFPVTTFFERPNRKDKPADFPSREYEIQIASQGVAIGGLYDTWTGADGETLTSCTMITLDGIGHPVMDSIYHNRIPFLLKDPLAWLKGEEVELVREQVELVTSTS